MTAVKQTNGSRSKAGASSRLDMSLPENVQARLARLANRYGLELVVLFGSQATGHANERSDFDVAYMPERRRRPNMLQLDVDLYSCLREVFPNADIHTADVRKASPLLALAVARDGIVLYESSIGVWSRFRAYAFRQWEDVRKVVGYWHEHVDRYLRESAAYK